MICKNEVIMHVGEIGREMYFILDGEVDVYSPSMIHLATLGVGKPIGEMALLSRTVSLRAAHVVAKTNVALAVLSLEDF
jgi:CRP-like cAMP-binding protein